MVFARLWIKYGPTRGKCWLGEKENLLGEKLKLFTSPTNVPAKTWLPPRGRSTIWTQFKTLITNTTTAVYSLIYSPASNLRRTFPTVGEADASPLLCYQEWHWADLIKHSHLQRRHQNNGLHSHVLLKRVPPNQQTPLAYNLCSYMQEWSTLTSISMPPSPKEIKTACIDSPHIW